MVIYFYTNTKSLPLFIFKYNLNLKGGLCVLTLLYIMCVIFPEPSDIYSELLSIL
jgi:hypothetical protein